MFRNWKNSLGVATRFLERYLGYLILLGLFLAQQHQARLKSHELTTLYYAERTEASLALMESAQRGYLLTQDPDMYTDFLRGQGAYKSWSAALKNALRNDAENSNRFSHVENVIQSKITEMKQTIDLAQTGNAEKARAIILSHQGQRYMQEARDGIRDIRASKEIQAISLFEITLSL